MKIKRFRYNQCSTVGTGRVSYAGVMDCYIEYCLVI